jgi:tetratricopeptide (TPR) repeat protein
MDELLRQRADYSKLREAVTGLRSLHQEFPGDREIAWKFAMATYSWGSKLDEKTQRDERLKLFDEGREAGERSLERNADCAPCHFWTGINHALLGNEKGIFSSVTGLKRVREHAQRVLELDEGYAFGGAHRLLGQIDRVLPGILGGNNSRARKHFEEAIRIAPDEPMNYFELSQLLANELDSPKEALNVARKGLSIGALPLDRVEGNETLVKLQNWIKKLEARLEQDKT